MEVHYCKKCRSRVSSFDIESGHGVLVGRDAYCRKCAKELTPAESQSAPVKQIQKQQPVRKQTPVKSEPATKATRIVPQTVQRAAERERALSPAPEKKSSPASILFLLIFIAVIGGLAYGLYLKKYKNTETDGKQKEASGGEPSSEKAGISNEKETESPETKEAAQDKPVEQPGSQPGKVLPAGYVIPLKAEWKYLAGSYAKGSWTEVEYDDSSWKTGIAGFGYGDKDDQTLLKDMRGNYTIVYIRKTFEIPDPEAVTSLLLKIKYDDGFVAYINTREVARSKVKGAEKNVKVESHESRNLEVFPIRNIKEILKKGVNVLAIEGHNTKKSSSDFTLDPCLVINE